ncbi:aminoglycoside phosphotransferase family protein [Chitinophaga sp. NPDC101104]|uniref:aminoglycoside phosphotransferase family protein n=1 Tax=Chitinophaga sp. NPDC101104 TaxID=3390561 RepID=UPI003CFDEC64
MKHDMDFQYYLDQWQLQQDGQPVITHSSRLLPVLHEGLPAMLKVAVEKDEQLGNEIMVWWNGQGAAKVLAHNGEALLMERATGPRNLKTMSMNGADDAATKILCATALQLHAVPKPPPDGMITMERWFADLFAHGHKYGGSIAHGLELARRLVTEEIEKCVLHGDLHHENVLDFEGKGWLAIDPKKLYGDRAFDFANIFCNPDLSIAAAPAAFQRRLQTVCSETGIERRRLLEWIVAWAALSAVWFIEDNLEADAATDLAVGTLAMVELDR